MYPNVCHSTPRDRLVLGQNQLVSGEFDELVEPILIILSFESMRVRLSQLTIKIMFPMNGMMEKKCERENWTLVTLTRKQKNAISLHTFGPTWPKHMLKW